MKRIDTFSHYREGKSQMQRFLTELNPDNLELHDFDLFDWLLFANNFAKHVNYFDKNDATTPSATWESFFLGDDNYDIPRRESIEYKSLRKQVTSLVSQFEQDGSMTPHLTLFVCFIKLLDFSKKTFNSLTKRHLDFYYHEILKMQKQEATPDKAYVIFELAKKAIQENIPGGTLLDAKKGVDGKKRIFTTDTGLTAGKAKVVELKSFLNDAAKKELKVAHQANTLDGLGAKLPETAKYWWPFGYNSEEPQNSDFKELDNARLGFSIASPLFLLREGERTVTVTLAFKDNGTGKLAALRPGDIENNIKLSCSGEEEWLSGFGLKCLVNDNKSLRLAITLPKEFPAVVNYNKDILPGNYKTDLPIFRFIIEGSQYYELYEALAEKQIRNVDVSVDVKGVRGVQIENDNGVLNAQKPYYPFTSQPVTGSNFYIRYPEMFSKKWNSASVTINWKNTPASIKDLYKAYILTPDQEITKKAFEDAANTSIVRGDDHFKATAALMERGAWSVKATGIPVFQKNGDKYQANFSINNSNTVPRISDGIRLTLNQSALQDAYPRLYTLALTSSPDSEKLIPNEPYIPFGEDIELHYTASDSAYSVHNRARDKKSAKNYGIQLFYEDAFGQYEKDASAKSILPPHGPGGQLYIGLDAKPGETVSLLIQALEGSENPQAEPFGESENIAWDILSDNVWHDLSEHIVINEPKQFLESGILKFSVPNQASTNSTRLSTGLVWLRAKANKSYDSVCKFQGIYTQTVRATMQSQGNDMTHFNNAVEAGTISKLITPVAQVKSVSQPYNSFAGSPRETDEAFYRRVSERLRHKNRAITQWDYEQLILQQFPEVYMVKCLNHTSRSSFMAPGHITLVVVPNTVNKNAFDIYQPRVSSASLMRIQNYVNGLNTVHVKAQAINPNYQEASIRIKVRFHDKDDAFYIKQLDDDIKKYISPWALGDPEVISFNVRLNVNQLVNYLEQLYYVDYIEELKVYVNGALQSHNLIEVDPKSILVSAKQHIVTIAEKICI